MKLIFKGYTYRKASDLEQILEKAPKTEKELKIFCYLVGIYSCRFLGIVRYKTKAGYDTDKIKIGRKLSECTTDDASGSKLNMPLVSNNDAPESSDGKVAVCELGLNPANCIRKADTCFKCIK